MANSVAPKERINITYRSKTDNQNSEVELPLKLMVMGNLTGSNNTPLEERKLAQINKLNFNQVMKDMNIQANFYVKNRLNPNVKDELSIELKIEKMKDFSPDSVAEQIPELSRLLKLRKALMSLKGPMGNIPDFRKAVVDALKDEKTKQKLLKEIEYSKNEGEKSE